jgi:hypothetical protein
LTGSLRDIGYDFPSAVADLVDNSVSAGAGRVDVLIEFDGPASHVIIADDGSGMTDAALTEALRFGTRREYNAGDLGRYGLGLKTASISQCRRLTVVTRRSPQRRRIALRSLDVDHIVTTDRWELTNPPADSVCHRALEWLEDSPGTVVVWEGLDRVLPENRPEGGWARRRLEQLAARTTAHLGMVFHRFIEGVDGRERLVITVNGEKVAAWNPFAPSEDGVVNLPEKAFELEVAQVSGQVVYRPYVLPPRSRFSSPAEFDRLSGPLKWNRQQGLYLYRADRMIQGGGWSGVRAIDEHTKLGRAALDFPTELDPLFQINVSKMRVSLPVELRQLMERPVQELCHAAEAVYRREAESSGRTRRVESQPTSWPLACSHGTAEVGAAIMSAALEAGERRSFGRIMACLQSTSPEIAAALGW